MKNNRFAKTQIATSLSIALGAFAAPMVAQADEAKDVEVIEVKGIRGSLVKSQDIKRSSSGVVDAISAEDIGKFPDTNLAESLQRITGVSIDRENGEGSKVTVRGFGPDYNLVTLNGRQMPTASIAATSASDSRSFDFGNLASEGVSSVEVYKTGKASVATGGIGSTINLVTVKPLAAPGERFSAGVKAVHDTSSETGSSLTPELSALYSNTFADDSFGVALSLSHQKRQSGSARAGVDGGWRRFTEDGSGGWGMLPPPPATGTDPHVNRPEIGDVYAVPQNLIYGFKEVERVRTNGQLTLQYQPVENLVATLDYTYSKNEVETNQNLFSVWMNHGHSVSEWTDPDSDGVRAPLVITENNTGVNTDTGELNFSDLVSQVEQSAQVNENKSLGFNLEYKLNDNLTLEFDYHNSTAEAKPDSIYGNSNTIQMATNVRGATSIDFTSDFPVTTVTYPSDVNPDDFGTGLTNPLSNVSSLGPEGLRTTGTSFRNSYMKSEIDQMNLSGSYVFDSGIIESIDFGVATTEVQNRSAFAMAERPTWGGVGSVDDIDNTILTNSLSNIVSRFDNLPGDKTNMIDEFFEVDFVTFADIVGSNYGVPLNADGSPADPAWPCGTTICAPSTYTTDNRTNEDSVSAYIQANLVFELADMPSNLSAGVRYESTDVTSETLLPDVLRIGWVSANEFAIERGNSVFFEGTGSYDYVLPSIDFNIEVTDDVVLRASTSQTLTRTGYGNLIAGQRISEARVTGVTGQRGNPGLKPIESTNYDISAEWYYEEGSYVSVGYFAKDVKNFVGTDYVTDSPLDITNPATGQRFIDAVNSLPDNLKNDNLAIRAAIIAQNPNDPNIDPENLTTGEQAKIWGSSENDIVEVKFSQPVNQDSASLDGMEFAVQHMFGETGFGAVVNYTYVDADLEFDNGSLEGQFALLGLSDSANAVFFYETDNFQVRLAYNWRDEFLAATSDGNDSGANPVYVDAYSQIDVNASYSYSENLTFFVEGINITDEYTRKHGRHERMVVNIEQSGPRYNFGARYSF